MNTRFAIQGISVRWILLDYYRIALSFNQVSPFFLICIFPYFLQTIFAVFTLYGIHVYIHIFLHTIEAYNKDYCYH